MRKSDNHQTSQSSAIWEFVVHKFPKDEIEARCNGRTVRISESEYVNKLKQHPNYPCDITDQDCIETILNIARTK